MRRGIANFRLLAYLLPPFYVGACSVGSVRQQIRDAREVAQLARRLPPVAPATVRWHYAYAGRLELRDVTLDAATAPDLTATTLTHCTLVGDWRGRLLRGALLWECDLRGANLDGDAAKRPSEADLRGCYYDAFTRWPAGFDPRAAGATLDE